LAKVRRDDFIFNPGRPISNVAMAMKLRRDPTAHGFRSSFHDRAAERTTFPAKISAITLPHMVGDKVEAVYRGGTRSRSPKPGRNSAAHHRRLHVSCRPREIPG
jgi:hypothetical protein